MPTVCVISSDLFGGQVCFTVVFPLRENDREDSVGSATRLVHVGGGHSPADLHTQTRLDNTTFHLLKTTNISY